MSNSSQKKKNTDLYNSFSQSILVVVVNANVLLIKIHKYFRKIISVASNFYIFIYFILFYFFYNKQVWSRDTRIKFISLCSNPGTTGVSIREIVTPLKEEVSSILNNGW